MSSDKKAPCNNLEWQRRILENIFISIGGLIDKILAILGPVIQASAKLFGDLANSQFGEILAIVLFLLFIVFCIFYGLSPKVNGPPSGNYSKPPNLTLYNPMELIKRLIPIPLYKLNNLSPYSKEPQYNSTDRPIISGRCDNLTKLSDSAMCLTTTKLEPIQWILDVDKMPELNELSTATRRLVDGGAESGKYIVTIPWKMYENEGFHYYPDCNGATFGNGESAKYLFTDNGIRTCEKRSVNRTINEGRVREKYTSNKYTTLDSYVS